MREIDYTIEKKKDPEFACLREYLDRERIRLDFCRSFLELLDCKTWLDPKAVVPGIVHQSAARVSGRFKGRVLNDSAKTTIRTVLHR
jgi:hypothetical protein